MATASRQDLRDYCLRALGAPVVEINVDDDQVEDRIDEALEMFTQYHNEGIEKIYMKHQVTEEDVANQYIPVNDLVYGITRVFPVYAASSASRNIFDLQYQLRLNDLYDLTSVSVIYYTQVMQHLSLLDMTLNGKTLYRYNRLKNRIHLDINWEMDVEVGQYLIFEAYRGLDPNEFTKLYNEPWLKHYLTALLKRQWGVNLKKFQGMQLPGGITIDGDSLYKESIDEIKELEDEIQNKSAPLEFFTG